MIPLVRLRRIATKKTMEVESPQSKHPRFIGGVLFLFLFLRCAPPYDEVEPRHMDKTVSHDEVQPRHVGKTADKMVEFLENYRWSSFMDYIGKKNFPSVTSREFLLDFFGGPEEYKKATYEWIRDQEKNMWQVQDVILED